MRDVKSGKPGGQRREEPGPGPVSQSQKNSTTMEEATKETMLQDRDLVLAHSLQRPFSPEKRITVGVVGAAHVPGVKRLWAEVPTADSRNRYEDILLKHPEKCLINLTIAGQKFYLAYGLMAAVAVVWAHPMVHKNSMVIYATRGVGVAAIIGVAAGMVAALVAAWVLVRLCELSINLEMAAHRAEVEGLAPARRKELTRDSEGGLGYAKGRVLCVPRGVRTYKGTENQYNEGATYVYV